MERCIPAVQLFSDLQVPLPCGARQTSPMLAMETPMRTATVERDVKNMIWPLQICCELIMMMRRSVLQRSTRARGNHTRYIYPPSPSPCTRHLPNSTYPTAPHPIRQTRIQLTLLQAPAQRSTTTSRIARRRGSRNKGLRVTSVFGGWKTSAVARGISEMKVKA